MSRTDQIEALKWRKFPVLNDGFVCLADCMGDDSSVVQAARVSYGAGTKKVSDDRGLIRYLMRHRHSSPFEMAEIKLLVRVPMDCWRQWIRHRTANVNEYSTRYSEAIDSVQTTEAGEWRLQSTVNNQGSSGYINSEEGVALTALETHFHEAAKNLYQTRLEAGVAREQARKDLPLCTYTEAYWKIDLLNLLNFLSQRMDSHAQLEIRQYATTIGEQILKPLFPLVWEAFQDYRVNAMQLTALDIGVMQRLHLDDDWGGKRDREAFERCQDPSWEGLERCRERDECWVKLVKLGVCK